MEDFLYDKIGFKGVFESSLLLFFLSFEEEIWNGFGKNCLS